MFGDYSAVILNNTDNQLMSLARSIDRSAESQIGRYMENLIHTIEHAERTEAERLWVEEGQERTLKLFLTNSLLGQDATVVDVLVFRDKEVGLSLSGEKNFKLKTYSVLGDFLQETDFTQVEDMSQQGYEGTCLCLRDDGQLTIAIVKATGNGITYAALVDLGVFYEGITANLSEDMHNEIVMMDENAQTLVYRQAEEVRINNISDISESESKYSMLKFLIKQQEARQEGTDFCDAISSATGKAYTARMAVVPATEETNGLFAVGVSTDYDEITRPMRFGTVKLIIYGGTALLGVVSLLILLIYTLRGNERVKREVELLKEKNAAMEELNRQTQEFAHHQRLELMGTLTSGIAHEFNNLLAPIMGYSILVLEKLPPEETELYDEVLEIYNTSTKAKTVVSRLQDLARKHAGNEYQQLVFDEVVQKAIEIARPAKPKPVELKLELKGEGRSVNGNETQLSQLLLNLLINAFHATEENNGFVTVSTEVKGDKIFLKVADNGYGMSDEVMKRMYEPFFTTKKGGQGTGLGLAIVEQIVEEHGGTIGVESKKGEGTVFLLAFPIISEES